MAVLKEDSLVKIVAAYAVIFRWLYPAGFIIITIVGIFQLASDGILPLGADIYRLLRDSHKEFFYPAKAPLWVCIFVFAANFLIFLPGYVALIRLNKFIQNISEQKPFIEENGQHLKFVGLITVLLTLLLTIIKTIFMHVYSGLSVILIAGAALISLLSALFNPYLILGLFVVVLGEVIIRGAKMKEEIDLTV